MFNELTQNEMTITEVRMVAFQRMLHILQMFTLWLFVSLLSMMSFCVLLSPCTVNDSWYSQRITESLSYTVVCNMLFRFVRVFLYDFCDQICTQCPVYDDWWRENQSGTLKIWNWRFGIFIDFVYWI